MQECLFTEEPEHGTTLSGDKSTCKGSKATHVMYKQVATERKNDQQAKLVVKLKKDIELLKEMVKEERLRNQKL